MTWTGLLGKLFPIFRKMQQALSQDCRTSTIPFLLQWTNCCLTFSGSAAWVTHGMMKCCWHFPHQTKPLWPVLLAGLASTCSQADFPSLHCPLRLERKFPRTLCSQLWLRGVCHSGDEVQEKSDAAFGRGVNFLLKGEEQAGATSFLAFWSSESVSKGELAILSLWKKLMLTLMHTSVLPDSCLWEKPSNQTLIARVSVTYSLQRTQHE